MNEITAPIIAITLVLLSVFVPVAFIPGIIGRIVPAVCRRGLGLDDHLGDQRADAVAGAVRGVPVAEPWAQARPDRLCAARHRPGARWLCADRPQDRPASRFSA